MGNIILGYIFGNGVPRGFKFDGQLLTLFSQGLV